MPNPLDRNASSNDRIRRNFQRLTQGAGTSLVKVVAPLVQTASGIGLALGNGLQVVSSLLTLKLASLSGLFLNSTGLGVSVDGSTITINSTGHLVASTTSGGGSTAFANASHLVTLTSTAGIASTAMRSDAGLQLDQTISPTMLGVWNFNSTVTINSRFLETPVLLTPSSAVTANASTGNIFTLLASTNFTLQAINGVDGVVTRFRITQNSTGGWVVTLGSTFHFGTDLTSTNVTIAPTANKTSYIAAMFNSTSGLFDVLGNLKGF
jgi:hypothetical protein